MDCSRWIHLIFSALLALWGVVSVSVGVADLGAFAYGASEMFYRASIHAFLMNVRSDFYFFVFRPGKILNTKKRCIYDKHCHVILIPSIYEHFSFTFVQIFIFIVLELEENSPSDIYQIVRMFGHGSLI